jgi:putative DNA primase/helicase
MLPSELTAEQVLGVAAVETRCLADIEAEALRWLWPGRIPLGKLTVISGDPGLGKSLVTLAIAATVSRGGSWPCEEGVAPLGSVLLVSAEDDPADTLRPRLEAAGADLQRVHILDRVSFLDEEGNPRTRPWSFRDSEALELKFSELPDCKLLVIDPISAYLAGTDSHKNSDVRSLLAPLTEMAARSGVAVLAVSHLNKSAGPAIYRTSGSLAFVAAARAVYAVAKDKENPARRLVLPIKSNLSRDSSGLAYQITEAPNGAPVITWEPETVAITAEDALEVVNGHPADRSEREEAKDWLREYLSNGPRRQPDVRRDSIDAGLSWATVRRARIELGLELTKTGFNGGWEWALPAKMLSNGEDAHPKHVSTFGESEHLGQDKGCTAEQYRRAKDGS